MYKYIVFIISIFLLSSCFWVLNNEKQETSKTTWLEIYSTWTFKVAIPRSWKKYKEDDNLLPKPIFWKVVLAASSKQSSLWFYNNFVILSQKLWTKISSVEYSTLNNVLSAKDYLEYKLLKQKNISFTDNDSSKVYFFEARYNIKSPKAYFIQTWKVCWKNWYLLTIWLSQMVKDLDKYEKILETFSCNNQKNDK